MKKLTLLAVEFAGVMLDKLFVNYKRGKSGWDMMGLSDIKLKMHLAMNEHDWVSVANYAMFAWYYYKRTEEK